MDLEVFLLWFSKISLVVWSGVLIWCVGTLVIRARRERRWEQQYMPTLNSDIQEYDIGSWTTLNQMETLKREEAKKRAAAAVRKALKRAAEIDSSLE